PPLPGGAGAVGARLRPGRLPVARAERRGGERARVHAALGGRRTGARLCLQLLADAEVGIPRRTAARWPLARARQHGLGVLRRLPRREHGRRRRRGAALARAAVLGPADPAAARRRLARAGALAVGRREEG